MQSHALVACLLVGLQTTGATLTHRNTNAHATPNAQTNNPLQRHNHHHHHNHQHIHTYTKLLQHQQPQTLLRLRAGQATSDGFFTRWLRKLLSNLGIFTKKGQLLVIGLDNAGKSSLLTMLTQGKVVQHEPTHQPVSDEFKVGSLKLRAVDMGGHAIARRMWREYAKDADAVVFIVDSADRERFEEAALELHKLLAGGSLPAQAPVLILGNKVDLPHAAREEELYYCLGMDQLQGGGAPGGVPGGGVGGPPGGRAVKLFMCSVFAGEGYVSGLEWLAQFV